MIHWHEELQACRCTAEAIASRREVAALIRAMRAPGCAPREAGSGSVEADQCEAA
jgi:hypothetical protein